MIVRAVSPPPLGIHDPVRRRRAGFVALALLALVIAFAWRRGPATRGALMPDGALTRDGGAEDFLANADALAERYPDDPRARYARAMRRSRDGDLRGAEEDLRAAVAALPALRGHDPGRRHETAIRATLAAMLSVQRREGEARAVAQPVCDAGPDGGVPSSLGLLGLCGR